MRWAWSQLFTWERRRRRVGTGPNRLCHRDTTRYVERASHHPLEGNYYRNQVVREAKAIRVTNIMYIVTCDFNDIIGIIDMRWGGTGAPSVTHVVLPLQLNERGAHVSGNQTFISGDHLAVVELTQVLVRVFREDMHVGTLRGLHFPAQVAIRTNVELPCRARHLVGMGRISPSRYYNPR